MHLDMLRREVSEVQRFSVLVPRVCLVGRSEEAVHEVS